MSNEEDIGQEGEGEIEESELPDYGEYDERGEQEGEFMDAEGGMEAPFESAQRYDIDQKKPPGLTWGAVGKGDILGNQQVLFDDDEDEYVGANRRNGVFIEGNKKFKFRADLEDFLVKQNYKGAGEGQSGSGDEEEGEVEDQAELLERKYNKFRSRITHSVLGLYGFLRGILAGMCFLLILMIFIPGNFTEAAFVESYEPLASTLSKIFILLTTVCFICSVFVINAKCWSPETSKFQKMNMLIEGIVYFIIVCCTFLCGTADDYFTSHNVTVSTSALTNNFYLWQVMNGIRSFLAILTYLGGTICNL